MKKNPRLLDSFLSMVEYEQASAYIRSWTNRQPEFGLILGSGLGQASSIMKDDAIIPYADIPHWPISTVLGHEGRLHLGSIGNHFGIVMEGRVHYLEGYRMGQVALPVRVMKLLGVKNLIITNAAGGLNQSFKGGDLMLIRDHINLLGMAGFDPLRGPNDENFGTRYPDMSSVYDTELLKLAHRAAKEANLQVREGTYICILGPSYSTPADLRLLTMFGADAVGMSTVPEAITAHHAGIRILGISCITDMNENSLEHEAVLESAARIGSRLKKLLEKFFEYLPVDTNKNSH